MSARPLSIIIALGTTQTLAWASSYYLPAILADPISRDLGVSSNWIFAAFSAALVLSALGAWALGVALDAAGGPSNASAWTAAFAVLAAGILLGPIALYWSRRVTVQP